jgi:2,4-dienoyl-CoA reductase-like NADH-dependent reductase (Old Yellow Enzyme family)
VGTIVTGFAYVSRAGRAMQPLQCGIDADDKIGAWAAVVAAARRASPGVRIFLQIAHAGRQTIPSATGGPVLAPSARRSPYFRSRPRAMREGDIAAAVDEFAAAAVRARRAGFDGVQIHAAHGYLIHQFLSPVTNRRRDRFGRDRSAFLREVVTIVRERAGDRFPVLVKLSGADDDPGGLSPGSMPAVAGELVRLGVDAVEVSHGTMDLAMNIFRGGAPVDQAVRVNPLFRRLPRYRVALWRRVAWPRMRRRLRPLREAYNREAAREIRKRAGIPVILVGGNRRLSSMREVVESGDADAIALARPLIREPDLVARFESGRATRARCVSCNLCAVLCDLAEPVRCHRLDRENGEGGER